MTRASDQGTSGERFVGPPGRCACVDRLEREITCRRLTSCSSECRIRFTGIVRSRTRQLGVVQNAGSEGAAKCWLNHNEAARDCPKTVRPDRSLFVRRGKGEWSLGGSIPLFAAWCRRVLHLRRMGRSHQGPGWTEAGVSDRSIAVRRWHGRTTKRPGDLRGGGDVAWPLVDARRGRGIGLSTALPSCSPQLPIGFSGFSNPPEMPAWMMIKIEGSKPGVVPTHDPLIGQSGDWHGRRKTGYSRMSICEPFSAE